MALVRVIENDARVDRLPEMLAWVRAEAASMVATSEQAGALLLRGFPVRTPEDFHELVVAFGLGQFSYRDSLSNAVRVDRTNRVFTANEAPPQATIRLHHELAQTPVHPRRLFFFCEHAAERGGETALCPSDQLYDEIVRTHPQLADALTQHGLHYHHVMPNEDDQDSAIGRSWRGTLSVDSKAAAEAKLASLEYTWEWRTEDALAVTSPRLSAIRELGDGRKSFFNQIVATRSWRDARNDPALAVRLGHGEGISLEVRDQIADRTEGLAQDLAWEAGDVVLLDNHRVQHGRRPFAGTRKVWVAFSAQAESVEFQAKQASSI